MSTTKMARAYSAISVHRSSPTIPAESSMYISVVVTRSTARRASGLALTASPASIMSATAAATAWALGVLPAPTLSSAQFAGRVRGAARWGGIHRGDGLKLMFES